MSKFIQFAQIVKPHGVKGSFVLRSNFANAKGFLNHLNIQIQGTFQPFVLQYQGILPNQDLIVSNDLIKTLENVKKYIGVQIFINSEILPKNEGEIYVFDVINLEVFTENDEKIGVVTDVVNFGSGPMLEVNVGKEKEKLEYFLYNKNTVKNVDLKSKKIIIILPEYV